MNIILSIIVPVYNVEIYLKKCLSSLINQTLKDIEIICVNDGSTDNSLSVLEECARKDDRIKVINQTNKGLATVRNVGIKASNGQFIAFVDSDDFVELDAYEQAIKCFDGNTDLVCFGIKVTGDANLKERQSDNEYYKIKYTGLVKQKMI